MTSILDKIIGMAIACLAVMAIYVPASAYGLTKVYIAQRLDASESQYKPRRIEASRDDTFRVSRVQWEFKRYNGESAPGTGIAVTTDCVPDCASSGRDRFKVRFKVSQPRWHCGRLFYTRLRITYLRAKPDYASRSREQSIAPASSC